MTAAEVLVPAERPVAAPADPRALEARFAELASEYGPAIQRVARGYEADQARQQDLAQEILTAIWTALPAFEGRSSVGTWVYRIAHNVAVTHVVRRRRDQLARAVPVDDDTLATAVRSAVREVEGRDAVHRLAAAVRALRPADAQVILLYLEGLTHAEIADVTGLSSENAAVKVHRIKAALVRALDEEETHR